MKVWILLSIIVAIIVLVVVVYMNCQRRSENFDDNDFPAVDAMYRLWFDHAFYTRLVMMSIIDAKTQTTSAKNVDFYVARLMKNQADIATFFGNDRQAVQNLLETHIKLAGKVVSLVSDKTGKLKDAIAALYTNAKQIGNYLDARFNVQESGLFTKCMKEHIDTLLKMTVDYASGSNDVPAIDSYLAATVNIAKNLVVVMSRTFA